MIQLVINFAIMLIIILPFGVKKKNGARTFQSLDNSQIVEPSHGFFY